MTFNTALCFPETSSEPFSRRFLPFFFDTLCYFTPASLQSEETTTTEKLVQFSFRNPFAEDRDSSRFASLAEELGGRGREYYRHFLSSQPAAAGGAGEESSVAALVSLVTGQTPIQDDEETRQRERHWQARLVLLLATLLTEEEEEIAKSLEEVAARKRQILSALQGTEEKMTFGAGQAWLPSRPFYPDYSPPQLKNLLQAFATFYLSDATAQQALPCTANSAGADLLLELYEKKNRQAAIELTTVHLPAMAAPDGAKDLPQLSFRQQTEQTRRALGGLLQQCTAQAGLDEELRGQVQQAAATFNAMSEATKAHGAWLTFYLLPGTPLATLLRAVFPQAAPAAPAANGANGLLALLRPA